MTAQIGAGFDASADYVGYVLRTERTLEALSLSAITTVSIFFPTCPFC
jgi:hypothetical protein